jgi:hypothetical protein
MKQKTFVLCCVALSCLVMMMASCSKDDLGSTNELVGSKLESRDGIHVDTLYEIVVNTFARGLLIKSQDATFRNFVNSTAGDELVGDYEVLGYQLDQSITGLDTILKSSIDQVSVTISSSIPAEYAISSKRYSNDLDTINFALDGFDYDDFKFYPQIYIFNYDSINLNQTPVIAVVSTEDHSVLFGYKLNSGTDTYDVVLVDEQFAKQNLVWVISTNEVIESQSALLDALNGGSGGVTLKSRSTLCAYYKITEVKLWEDLETWWGGKNDISFAAMHVQSSNGIRSGDGTFQQHNIVKIKGKDINKWFSIGGDKGWMVADNDLFCEFESLDFVIYEKDRGLRKWQRDWNPYYNGSCSNESSEILYWYSSDQNFITQSFPVCSREFGELGSATWALDMHANWPEYQGEAKLYYGIDD